jgi:alkanesulfonate monooxygenase SsuD/methylene tetrahydromethanopterin reductase-like flavin-dependent oxidoreductase (luciferase family)
METAFSYDGTYFKFDDVSVFPKPIQQPHPPLLQAAVSSTTFASAGATGTPILTSPNFTPIELVRDNFDTYRTSLRENGFDPDAYDYPILQQVYVSDDPQDAVEFPREYAMYYYDRLARLLPSLERGDIPSDYAEYAKIQRNVEQLKYSFLLEHGINVGTPDAVIARIETLRAEAGVNYYIGWFGFGGMPADRVERSMRLFAEKVMPAFASAPSASRTRQ